MADPGRYAIITRETKPTVLLMVDDQAEANAIADEMRRNGHAVEVRVAVEP